MKMPSVFNWKKALFSSLFLLAFFFGHSQNLFFIGERSYPCTESFSFNSKESFFNKLDILIAKGNGKGFIALSRELSSNTRIKGKIMIYLDDGTVITCVDRNRFDHVNGIGTTIYHLTTEELDKMKRSNINSIRYALKCESCTYSSEEGNYAVTNKATGSGYSRQARVDVPGMIRALF